MSISIVTALLCFTSISLHRLYLLKTSVNYFLWFGFSFAAIVFTVTGCFWTQGCTAVLHTKKPTDAQMHPNPFCTFLTLKGTSV